ncbi:Vacuolar ATP synthase subunit C [Ascosphaera acerosa]|nr:Vacuolar ATP synthase subunit C [Ascosphaera acerosa]
MSSATPRYILLSLPSSIAPSHHRDDALDAVRRTVAPQLTSSAAASGDRASGGGGGGGDGVKDAVVSFPIPEFKVGTLDMLVQQADELARLSALCEAVVGKVGEALRTALGGDEERLEQAKTVDGKPVGQYLCGFGWNRVKYRMDKPLGELISMFSQVGRLLPGGP